MVPDSGSCNVLVASTRRRRIVENVYVISVLHGDSSHICPYGFRCGLADRVEQCLVVKLTVQSFDIGTVLTHRRRVSNLSLCSS